MHNSRPVIHLSVEFHLLFSVLGRRLESWVKGYEEKFVEEALAQVEELKKEAFGERFLQCIGSEELAEG